MELPSIKYDCFHLCYVRFNWNGSLKPIDLVNPTFSFDDLVSLELKWVIVPRLEPTHGWVVICLPCQMLISPFSFLSLIVWNSFCYFSIFHINYLKRIRKVRKFVPIVIVPSFLLNAYILGLGKSIYIRLIWFLIHKLMRKIWKFVSFKIQDWDSIFSSFHKYGLFFIKHTHSVHWNLELILK
jgi:hypothetical protein